MIDAYILGGITLLLGIIAAYRTKEQRWNTFGTVVGGVGAALALGIGVWNFKESAELQREVTALTLYREHLQSSFDQPLLARASCLAENPLEASQQREKYSWFVVHGLHSFESILEAIEYADSDDQAEWHAVIREFADVHRCYFDSRDYNKAQYDQELVKIIESVTSQLPIDTDTDSPWRAEALQGNCIPRYEVLRTQSPWCQGFKSEETTQLKEEEGST